MREIKFRGLDSYGDWVYGFYLYDENRKRHFILNFSPDGSLRETIVKEETVGQFIDIEDDKGKEIYENDIISDTEHGQEVRKFVVENIRTITRQFDNSGHSSKWEVIGNIHENLELLK